MGSTGPRSSGRSSRFTLVVLLALSAVACGGDGEPIAPPAGSSAVSFRSTDGVELEGRLVGHGDRGVVLSHMLPSDQTSWWELAGTLADEGYLVLTYDFRGYCPGGRAGCSQGEKDVSAIWQDTLGAIDFLRSKGARSVALIGASMGGTSSLLAAAKGLREGVPIPLVITLSAPVSIEGLTIDPATMSEVTSAKLFIAGSGDASAADSAQLLYDMTGPPKRVEILPSDDHGTDLLTGNRGAQVQQMILRYLDQYGGEGA